MKKKEFLTEAKRKAIIADKEKAIIESFAKTFNKIKRIDENEINDIINSNAGIPTGGKYKKKYKYKKSYKNKNNKKRKTIKSKKRKTIKSKKEKQKTKNKK